MRKILTAAIFTLALTGFAVSAAPEAEAASIINPSKAAIVDVVNDMSAVQQVRGSNRYKEQMRFHLLQGKRGDGAALRQIGFHYAKGWGVIRVICRIEKMSI